MTDQKHYPMPAMTEQEREAAISFCVDEIAHLERGVKAYPDAPVLKTDLVTRKIALAALTAGPADRIMDAEDEPVPLDVTKLSNELNCSWPIGTEFYTAPPVIALKPVMVPQSIAPSYASVAISARDEQWFQAIREAGFEVKDAE